jgi:hypothetical protein
MTETAMRAPASRKEAVLRTFGQRRAEWNLDLNARRPLDFGRRKRRRSGRHSRSFSLDLERRSSASAGA